MLDYEWPSLIIWWFSEVPCNIFEGPRPRYIRLREAGAGHFLFLIKDVWIWIREPWYQYLMINPSVLAKQLYLVYGHMGCTCWNLIKKVIESILSAVCYAGIKYNKIHSRVWYNYDKLLLGPHCFQSTGTFVLSFDLLNNLTPHSGGYWGLWGVEWLALVIGDQSLMREHMLE